MTTALVPAGVDVGVGAHAAIEGCSVSKCGVGVRCAGAGGGTVLLSRVHQNATDGLELLDGASLDVRCSRVYENGRHGISAAVRASGSFVRNDIHGNRKSQVVPPIIGLSVGNAGVRAELDWRRVWRRVLTVLEREAMWLIWQLAEISCDEWFATLKKRICILRSCGWTSARWRASASKATACMMESVRCFCAVRRKSRARLGVRLLVSSRMLSSHPPSPTHAVRWCQAAAAAPLESALARFEATFGTLNSVYSVHAVCATLPDATGSPETPMAAAQAEPPPKPPVAARKSKTAR
jgi:hypothetical protein